MIDTVYIAGKMSGLPDLGRVAFDRAESKLRGAGYRVINPACMNDDLPRTAYMPICLSMLQQADALVLLPGWKDSPGARLERAFADYQEMQVFELSDFFIKRGLEVGYDGQEPQNPDLYR